ncbi:MAG: 6-pyruvoyl-tetrahydropterin synthase-related protein [Promethearchaeota archaeon]
MKNRFISLKKEYYWLLFISLYFFAISAWILPSGIPGGIDTNSHLFKVLYLSKYGLSVPWCHAWYAGYPFLLFYPPISYYLAAGVSTGSSALLSFKVVSILFFCATPFSIYYLARNLNFNEKESLLAAFFVGMSPVFIMNLLYYGRFPNVVAFPLVCLALGAFIHSYKKSGSFVIPALIMGFLVLIHHLSAFIGFFLILLFSIFEIIRSHNLKIVRLISLVTLVALAIGAVWIIPFIANINYYGQFFNPSMPILSLKFLLRFYISMIGFSHIILSMGLLLMILFYRMSPREGNKVRVLFMFVFFAIIIIYTLYAFLGNGFTVTIKHLLLILICVTFILLIYLLPQFTEYSLNLDINIIFSAGWFILFFWLTLGPRAILFAIFPLSQALDILRFMLYASIPVSLLGARMFLILMKFLKKSYHSISLPNKFVVSILIIFLSFSFIIPFIQPRYGQGGMLYAEDIFQKNQEIPQPLITYLKDSKAYGRILSIHSPSWVYSLPYYTDKPLIDGWFPQTRFLYPFNELSSYTINDLVASEQWVWEYLIDNASLYGIKWVLIDDKEKLHLVESTEFHLALQIDSLHLYEANFAISFIEVENGYGEIVYERPRPDTILIHVSKATQNLGLLVKEAYFPHWHVENTENNVEVKKSEIGFISLSINSEINSYEIKLIYEYPLWQRTIPITVSILSFVICLIIYCKSIALCQIQNYVQKFLKKNKKRIKNEY